MFAYLIDRKGSLATNKEIIAVLFEDEVTESYFRKIRLDLLNALPNEIFVRQRSKIGVDKTAVDCDYYDYLDNKDMTAKVSEYMSQYSWSEGTFSGLLLKNF